MEPRRISHSCALSGFVVQKLASRNKTAYSVNPSSSKVDPSQSKLPVAQYSSLTEVVEDGKQIDVVNLVINPVKGISKWTRKIVTKLF